MESLFTIKNFNNSIWSSWDEVISDFRTDDDHWRIIGKQVKFIKDNHKKFTNEEGRKAFTELNQLCVIENSYLLVSFNSKFEKIREKFFGKFTIDVLVPDNNLEDDINALNYFKNKLHKISMIPTDLC